MPPLLRTHQDEPNGRDVCDGSDHVASNNAYHCRHDGGLNHHSIGLAIEPIGELLDQLVIVLDMILAHRVIPSPSAPSRCGTLTRPHVKPDSLMVLDPEQFNSARTRSSGSKTQTRRQGIDSCVGKSCS